MPRQPIDWDRHRESWIGRNLRSDPYTLKDLARDEGLSYDVLARKARERRWRAQLDGARVELNHSVTTEVRERTKIDQVAARLEHLDLADAVKPILEAALRRCADMIEREPSRVSVRDTVAVGRLWTKLVEVGAGLPRVHDPAVQEVPEEILLNREQQRGLRKKAEEFRDYMVKRGFKLQDPDEEPPTKH